MTASKITIGNVEIASLTDGILEFDICNFFPDIPASDWEPFHDHLTPDHKVSFNLACFLIRSEGKTIAVDTGLGAKDTPETPWGELLDDMASNGLSPNDIDAVVMTHLHRDHVGWNTVRDDGGNLRPTFPNARYYFSKVDLDASHDPSLQPDRFPNAPDCVWPLVDMGLVGVDGRRVQHHRRVDHPAHAGPHAGPHEHHGQLRRRTRPHPGRRSAQHRPDPANRLGFPR